MTLASLLAVLGAWLGFANPVYRLPILALLFPAGLAVAAVRAQSPARAARTGFWIGSLAALGNLYWAVLPVHDYGGLAWPLALPIPALLAMALGLYTAVYAAVITPNTRIAPQDDVDRLKGIAFWYWEYMRRNPLYIRYCDVFNCYHNYFESLGVYEYMQSKEFLDEMSEYVSTHDTREELKNFPFRKRLEKEFGDEAGKRTFKYGCLSCGFENHFERIYKHYSIGIDTEKVLNDELSGKIFPFTTDNPADIAALVKLNGSWLITVDDFQPDTFCYDIKRAQSIKVNPNGVINQLGKVNREFQALNMINMAVEAMFKEQKIPDDMLE